LIIVIGALLAQKEDAVHAAPVVAATVGAAGLLQLTIVAMRSGGNRIASRLRIGFDQEMRDFLAKAIPGMIAGAGPQLFIVAGAIIASGSPSAVSWLYFANRLIELPLGIVGVAMGAVLVPELTRAVRIDDRGSMMHAQSRALELAVGLALPATVGLIALSEPIVRMLFEHGAFTPADAAGTARALIWLAIGLPAHVLIKALSPAFFAREDTITPLLATLKGFALAIALSIVLGQLFGVGGIAASVVFGAWSSAMSLIRRGGSTFGFSLDASARRRLPRIVAAALAMGALLWLVAPYVLTSVTSAHGLAQALVVGALIAAGIALYGLLLGLLGVIDRGEVVNALRQNTGAGLRD
jgi:putative peptidoglycan lipid II flippase